MAVTSLSEVVPSVLTECFARANQALRAYSVSGIDDQRVLTALFAWCATAGFCVSDTQAKIRSYWLEAHALSELLKDRELEARTNWGLWSCAMLDGNLRDATTLAAKFSALALEEHDQARLVISKRLIGISLHLTGDQNGAREQLQQMLSLYDPATHQWSPLGHALNHRVIAQAIHARVLWLQGESVRSLQTMHRACDAAMKSDNAILTVYVLLEAAVPVAILAHDLAFATTSLALARPLVSRFRLTLWRSVVRCFDLLLESFTPSSDFVVPKLRTAIAQVELSGSKTHLPMFRAHLAVLLALAGLPDDADEIVNTALSKNDQTGNCWLNAELHRIRGDLAFERFDLPSAEPAYVDAVAIARAQGARWLQLRSATALAKIWTMQGYHQKARELLAPIVGTLQTSGIASMLEDANAV